MAGSRIGRVDVSRSPGASDEYSLGVLADVFAEHLGGHRLLGNSSSWGRFRTRRARRWVTGAVAFIGDAVHTAHFSVGSGTKMAMEDAIALAEAVRVCDSVPAALERFQQDRIHQVDRLQQLASTSLDWWEHFGVLHGRLAPWQFAVNFFTRSVTVGDLEQRDPAFIEAARAVWRAGSGGKAVLDTPLATAAGTAIRRVGRFDGTVGAHARRRAGQSAWGADRSRFVGCDTTAPGRAGSIRWSHGSPDRAVRAVRRPRRSGRDACAVGPGRPRGV